MEKTKNTIWNNQVTISSKIYDVSECRMKWNSINKITPVIEMQRQQAVKTLKSKLIRMANQLGIHDLPNSIYECWQFCLKLKVNDVR